MELMAEDLGVSRESAVPTAVKQLLCCLKDLHAARVVHRDVKPLNMILDERDRRFRLIDLGAAVDLATGINYVPDESILDANFCAPEHYVLPTDSVDLAEQASRKWWILEGYCRDDQSQCVTFGWRLKHLDVS